MLPILTNRYYLRKFNADDFSSTFKLYTNFEVGKYSGGVKNKNAIKKLFERYLIDNNKPFNVWAIIDKVNNEFVGEAGLTELFKEIELGYRLLPQYWNKGVATEVSLAIIDRAFNNLNINSIIAVTRPENIASQRVLSKIGMKFIKQISYNKICLYYFKLEFKVHI